MRLAVPVLLIAACAQPGDHVKMLSSPADDPLFVTRCKHEEQCIKDAKVTCPEGYRKQSFDRADRELELKFNCHGKANW